MGTPRHLSTEGKCPGDGKVASKAKCANYFMRAAAAQAYDAALVRMRGTAAATNFALAGYRTELAEFLNVQQVTLDVQSCLGLHASRTKLLVATRTSVRLTFVQQKYSI